MNDLTSKTAIVTGASRGLGAATAAELARRGAMVFANHPDQDADAHREAIEQWQSDETQIAPENIIPLAADIGNPQCVAEMFEAVGRHATSIDILVNNAGINLDRTIAKMTDDEWREVNRVNLDGTFYCCRAAVGHLRDHGRIVNISSLVAYTGAFGTGNYAASKAGVLGLTRSLALELASRKITVNAVCPGYFDTQMTQGMPPEVLQQYVDRIPLGRVGQPREIAQCVAFLASDQAAYITGQAIHVNGGIYLG